MGAGRPTTYTPEIALEICARIQEGQTLNQVCNDESMPCNRTIYRWLRDNSEFCQLYARAKEDQADTYADEIIEIADQSKGGKVADVQSAALRVDARKWVAAKLKPRKYMDSRAVTGLEGGPVQIVISQDDSEL